MATDNSLQARLDRLIAAWQWNGTAANNLRKEIASSSTQSTPVLPTLQEILNQNTTPNTANAPAQSTTNAEKQAYLDAKNFTGSDPLWNNAKIVQAYEAKYGVPGATTSNTNNLDTSGMSIGDLVKSGKTLKEAQDIFQSNRLKETNLDVAWVDQGAFTDYEKNFNKNADAYLEAQRQVYWLETERWLDQFWRQLTDLGTSKDRAVQWYDWQGQDLASQNARDIADYQKFTSREQAEFNRNLATRSKDFSSALSSAASAYGQKGILRSGVAVKLQWEQAQKYNDDTQYLRLQEQNKLEDADLAMDRANENYQTQTGRLGTQKGQTLEDYTTKTGRLNEDITNYKGDQAAKTEAWIGALQTNLDSIYNQGLLTTYQLESEQNKQAAVDKIYGRTSQPVRLRLRSGGTYTSS